MFSFFLFFCLWFWGEEWQRITLTLIIIIFKASHDEYISSELASLFGSGEWEKQAEHIWTIVWNQLMWICALDLVGGTRYIRINVMKFHLKMLEFLVIVDFRTFYRLLFILETFWEMISFFRGSLLIGRHSDSFLTHARILLANIFALQEINQWRTIKFYSPFKNSKINKIRFESGGNSFS